MAAELKQISIERSVGSAITTSSFDLLPDELRSDYAVSWLKEFSDTELRREKRWDKDYPESYFIMDMLRKIVADNVKFYCAVLFHIGRRLKVSQLADWKIASALELDNIQKTIDTNEIFSIQSDRSQTIGILKETLNEAKKVHSIIAEENWSLWQIWKKEIEQFQKAMQSTSEKLYHLERDYRGDPMFLQIPVRLMSDSFQHKELKMRMDKLGFQVNIAEAAVDGQTLVLMQLLAMDSYELRERVELLKLDNISRGLDADALRKQREQEMSSFIQKQLTDEFGNKDPFKDYVPLGKLPDDNLYNLYIKCQLPDYSRFYYAERWLQSLDEPINYYYESTIPMFKSELTAEDISNYARGADSAIKRNWVEKNEKVSVLPEQRMQFSLEKEWIEPFIVGIRYGDKNRNKEWTLVAVTEIIATVIVHLNKLGYQLSLPGQERLLKLWTIAAKEYYNIEW